MEHGKWRFTSPTHTVRAFHQALRELEAEGGVSCRWARYQLNHATLVQGMRALGFETLLDDELQSPIITTFRYPSSEGFGFSDFYVRLKKRGFVIYPGKLSDVECFRIGTIGTVFPADMKRLVNVIAEERFW